MEKACFKLADLLIATAPRTPFGCGGAVNTKDKATKKVVHTDYDIPDKVIG